MFIARMHSQFVFFRNERIPISSGFAHFGRALTHGRFSFYKHLVPTALSRQTLRSVSAVLWSFERQFDAKGRSVSRLALNVDVATVQVEDLAHDRQA